MHIFHRMKIIARIYPGVSKVSTSSCYTFLNQGFDSVYIVFTRSKHRQSHVSFVIWLNLSTSKMCSDNYCILETHSEKIRVAFCKEVAQGIKAFFFHCLVFFSVSQVFSPEQRLGEIILFNISIKSLTHGPESHLTRTFLSITV